MKKKYFKVFKKKQKKYKVLAGAWSQESAGQ